MRRHSIFLSPAGAGIAAVCFFLPWIKGSCGPITVEANGVRIGGIFWLVFAAALLTIALFAYFWKRRQFKSFRLAAISCASVSFGIIVYKFIETFSGNAFNIDFAEIGSMLRVGAFGTLFGLALTVVGVVITDKRQNKKPDIQPSEHSSDSD